MADKDEIDEELSADRVTRAPCFTGKISVFINRYSTAVLFLFAVRSAQALLPVLKFYQ